MKTTYARAQYISEPRDLQNRTFISNVCIIKWVILKSTDLYTNTSQVKFLFSQDTYYMSKCDT